MAKQMTIYDFAPDFRREPEIGETIEEHGAVICHIMRKAAVGRKVCYPLELYGHRMRVGLLERYYKGEDGWWHSVILEAAGKETVLTHKPGVEIFYLFPFNFYNIKKREEA